MNDLINVLAIAFFLFVLFLAFTFIRGQNIHKQTSTKKRAFKGALDSDNEEEYRSKHSKTNTAKNLFGAVSIAHELNNCCVAVTRLGNVRYLNKEAPLLPLRNCSQKDRCSCRYVHHNDRRASQRRNTFTTIQEDALDQDRRKDTGNRGRRFTDKR